MAQEPGTRPHLRPVSAVVDIELCVCFVNMQVAVSEGHESAAHADDSPSICPGVHPNFASIRHVHGVLPQSARCYKSRPIHSNDLGNCEPPPRPLHRNDPSL